MSPGRQTLRLLAPAKLNLGLRVLGQRSDGYHLIESLFVPIDLVDDVTLTISPGPPEGPTASVEFSLLGESGSGGVPADGDNLAARAARRFLAHTGLSWDVEVTLRKRIPAGAGMGGGSSDAGAVLRGLAEASGVSTASLSDLALSLGADVPYFLDPRPAVVGGIGEQVAPVEGFPGLPLLLVNPGISLATADVFRAFDEGPSSLTQARPGSTMRALSGLLGDPGALSSGLEELLVNDLTPAAVRLCPEIALLRERLRGVGAVATGMSGSGATVFGMFASTAAAREALERAAFEPTLWARTAKIAGMEQAGKE